MKSAMIKLLMRCGLQRAWGKANDVYLGIETGDDGYFKLPHERSGYGPKHKDSICYQPADYRNIRQIVRVLNPSQDELVYDIGCGKGRVVCVFAQRLLRRVVGIELDTALCDVARTNAARLRGKRSPIDIRCEDAALADLSDGTIYFMYNPFGIETMREVLNKIKCSLYTNPRMVRIVYYNSVLEEALLDCRWLRRCVEFKTLTGRPITFWDNRLGSGPKNRSRGMI